MSPHAPRLFVALYTDEDVTADLAPALRWRGYTAQSTAEAGHAEMSDEAQLTYATEQGMTILTYNAQDFIPLARVWYTTGREHARHYPFRTVCQRQFAAAVTPSCAPIICWIT